EHFRPIPAHPPSKSSAVVRAPRLRNELIVSENPQTTVAENGTTTSPSFADMALHPAVAQSVVDLGYETPSAIQARTIPALLEGRDVIGLAQTGTGKTAAFALPTLSAMAELGRATDGPHALVLTP